MELPELSESVEGVKQQAKTLCPWLPDPYTCDKCSQFCDAVVTYDYHMYEYTDAWRCPECGNEYYRERY